MKLFFPLRGRGDLGSRWEVCAGASGLFSQRSCWAMPTSRAVQQGSAQLHFWRDMCALSMQQLFHYLP